MPQRPGQPRPLSETPRLRPLFLALRTLCIATAASMATAGCSCRRRHMRRPRQRPTAVS